MKLLFTKIPSSKNPQKSADTNKNNDKKFLLYFIEQLHVFDQTDLLGLTLLEETGLQLRTLLEKTGLQLQKLLEETGLLQRTLLKKINETCLRETGLQKKELGLRVISLE